MLKGGQQIILGPAGDEGGQPRFTAAVEEHAAAVGAVDALAFQQSNVLLAGIDQVEVLLIAALAVQQPEEVVIGVEHQIHVLCELPGTGHGQVGMDGVVSTLEGLERGRVVCERGQAGRQDGCDDPQDG
jgi:hypothetical protein